jgi:hypothetical protein
MIDGGGGLWTICGFGLKKRSRKRAHIVIVFFRLPAYIFPSDCMEPGKPVRSWFDAQKNHQRA